MGITFKYVDLSNQRNLMVRTLWWQPPKKPAATANVSPPVQVNNAGKTTSNKVVEPERYIELLSPASHWMALMFWEQKLLSNVRPIDRILRKREKRRKARIFYLMGALYYAHADQYPEYKSFFCQLAVEHFRQASTTDTDWNLPYLYLANLYSFKAAETIGEKEEIERLALDSRNSQEKIEKFRHDAKNLKEKSEKLCKKAAGLYDDALKHAKNKYTLHRILVDKALSDLAIGVISRNLELQEKTARQVENLRKEIDPADFDPRQAECAAYLYNLATWYNIALEESVPMPNVNATDEARRYLAYSLARSPSLRETLEKDKNFESLRISGDVEILLEILEEVRSEYQNLAELTGEAFKSKLDSIPQKIDQRKLERSDVEIAGGVSEAWNQTYS